MAGARGTSVRILPRTLRLFLIAIGCLLGVSAWAAPLDDGLDGELLAEGNALWFSLHSYPGLSDSWQWFDARTGDAVAFGDERPLPVGLAINELEIRLLFRHALTGERLTLVLQRRDDAQAAYGRTALYNLFYQVETADSIGEQGVAFLQEALEVLHRTQPAYTMLWPKDEAERLLASRAVNNKPDDGFRVGMVQESETLRRTGLLWGVTFSLLFLVVLAGSVVSFPMALTRNTWPLSSTRQELVTVWGILLPLGKTLFIVVWGLYGSDIPPQSPVAVGSFWGGDSLSGLPSTWLLAFLHEAFSGLAPVWAHALLRLGIEYLTLLSALFLVSELTRDSRILTGVMLTLIALPLVSPSFGQPAGLLLPCCLGGFLAGFLLYARRLEKRHLLMSLGYGGLLGFVHPLAPLGVLFLIPMLVHVTRDDPGTLACRGCPHGTLGRIAVFPIVRHANLARTVAFLRRRGSSFGLPGYKGRIRGGDRPMGSVHDPVHGQSRGGLVVAARFAGLPIFLSAVAVHVSRPDGSRIRRRTCHDAGLPVPG